MYSEAIGPYIRSLYIITIIFNWVNENQTLAQ